MVHHHDLNFYAIDLNHLSVQAALALLIHPEAESASIAAGTEINLSLLKAGIARALSLTAIGLCILNATDLNHRSVKAALALPIFPKAESTTDTNINRQTIAIPNNVLRHLKVETATAVIAKTAPVVIAETVAAATVAIEIARRTVVVIDRQSMRAIHNNKTHPNAVTAVEATEKSCTHHKQPLDLLPKAL